MGNEPAEEPAFTNLADAVTFIVKCIDDDDTNQFFNAVAEPTRDFQTHFNRLAKVFVELKRQQSLSPLQTRYIGKDFPTNATTFGLGGPGKELGNIDVYFVQSNGVWRITDAYIVGFM